MSKILSSYNRQINRFASKISPVGGYYDTRVITTTPETVVFILAISPNINTME